MIARVAGRIGSTGMGRLDGKAALITGGGSGIGRATAELFLAEGCRVAIGDINAESIRAVVAAAGAGAAISGVHADVSDAAAARHMVDEAVRSLGGLDVLVCAAGITSRSRISRLSEEEFDRVIAVNLKGVYTVISAAIPALTENGGGTIVTVGSEMGLVGEPNAPVYNASKAAVIMFTKSIALDLIGSNIRVNTICPGITQTPLLEEELRIAEDPEKTRLEFADWAPIGRVADPVEQARGILFLATEESSFAVGSALVVDGGFTAR
jgi:NAD(P)-dependent dehydrogenase (short-subunit alcohol dehydrogenase family)